MGFKVIVIVWLALLTIYAFALDHGGGVRDARLNELETSFAPDQTESVRDEV